MKQQGEIAALNRAQEKAEARVSSIHHQLTASESELSVLEGEMAQVSTIAFFFQNLEAKSYLKLHPRFADKLLENVFFLDWEIIFVLYYGVIRTGSIENQI